MKALFICKRRLDSYGMSFGLINSATMVSNFLIVNGISSNVIAVTDANDIDREVTMRNPDLVFIEALWVTPDKMRDILRLPRHSNRIWVVRLHSKVTFIANEGIAFNWMNGYSDFMQDHKNFWIAPNVSEFAEDLAMWLDMRSVYLPNVYFALEPPVTDTASRLPGVVEVGCFGAMRPMKNHLIQAIASLSFADRIGKRLWFHVNGTRVEQQGDQVVKNLRALFASHEVERCGHHLIEHPWMNHADFIKLVRKMDIGVQASLSESFNIVTTDFVENNIPVVVSGVDWMPWAYKADPSSSDSIEKVMYFAYKFRGMNLHFINRVYLAAYNYKAERVWATFLSNIDTK